MFEFQVSDTSGAARAGVLHTSHGAVRTPVFMPVGTVGSVKAIGVDDLDALGAEIILGNTYHLYLRPGEDTVAAHDGLQKFTGWNKPMLTDSGGFQVYSLGRGAKGEKLAKIDNEGVTFRSHIDGSKHRLTPEGAVAIQGKLGADIIMALDDVVPANVGGRLAKEAMLRTNRWLERQVKVWRRELDPNKQAFFGIIQGGTDALLRRQSIAATIAHDLPGYAIGGISTGQNQTPNLWPYVAEVAEQLPADKPRYLMGVGEPLTFLEAVNAGIDMMDCVLPTRLARHGAAWVFRTGTFHRGTSIPNAIPEVFGQEVAKSVRKSETSPLVYERLDLMRAGLVNETGPLMAGCPCLACTRYSLGTLAHFVRIKEPLAMRLLSLHNLTVLFAVQNAARAAIAAGTFTELLAAFRQSTKQ